VASASLALAGGRDPVHAVDRYGTNTLAAAGASSTAAAWAIGYSEPRHYTFYPLAMQNG
jgi:hypothetical protein